MILSANDLIRVLLAGILPAPGLRRKERFAIDVTLRWARSRLRNSAGIGKIPDLVQSSWACPSTVVTAKAGQTVEALVIGFLFVGLAGRADTHGAVLQFSRCPDR